MGNQSLFKWIQENIIQANCLIFPWWSFEWAKRFQVFPQSALSSLDIPSFMLAVAGLELNAEMQKKSLI